MVDQRAAYSNSHQSASRANTYDADLSSGYQGMLWYAREAPLVEHLLARTIDEGATSALDFACGTGRILKLEHDLGLKSTGVDVSAAMLEVCRKRVPEARLMLSSIDAVPATSVYDVITAFRFFTNADDWLRDQAVATARRLLPVGGHFISNVHLQSTSPGGVARLAARMIRGAPYPHAYSWRAHSGLLQRHGFEIVDVVPYGVLPNLGRLAPRWYTRLNAYIESCRAVRKVPSLHDCVVLVARRVK